MRSEIAADCYRNRMRTWQVELRRPPADETSVVLAFPGPPKRMQQLRSMSIEAQHSNSYSRRTSQPVGSKLRPEYATSHPMVTYVGRCIERGKLLSLVVQADAST